ncbi:MAG: hypothetical protein CVU56_10725 [Deltaproteobacteria bacterium HGW-Deltaproteobacteria-14]|nr:MAG: hypothetical protein CVU56_10725 [Deltaproteobacteria bacterium HGW-Deltaproteobacteria-14]
MVALVVLVAGLLSGFALSAITRRRDGAPADDGGAAARLAELEARRAQLMEQLRLVGIDAAAPGERATLERQAAEVLRELDGLTRAASPAAPAAPVAPAAPAAPAAAHVAAAPAPAPARPRAAASTGLPPQLIGALKGGVVVGIAFLLYTTLSNQTAPRQPGGSITGNDAVAPMSTPSAATGAATGMGGGGSDPGAGQQAGSLAPQETPRLSSARAELEAHPDSREAKVALGWALVEAGGWIDVYHLADELVAANASDPDGLALAVAVRVAMGQREGLAPLVDQALMEYPEHAMLLAFRGRIAQLTGDAEGKASFFAKALAAAADKAEMQRLIAAFEVAGVPTSRHPGPGAAPAPVEAAGGRDDGTAAFEGGVSGTVTLAAGVSPPPGAVLFLIARTPGGNGGPPTATRKIVSPTFPRAFTLGPADVMMGGPFPDAVTIQARLDSDGNPMTREATDLVAAWPDEVRPGQRGIVLELAPSR